MKLAYIGIDLLYPALPALYEAGCEIIEIFTCETDNVAEFNLEVCAFAKEHSIPLTVGRVTQDDLTRLVSKGCEAVISAGYYYRLPIDRKLKMLNIHPALLPLGRGAWPMPLTILKGLAESGVTVHKLTEGFDEGDILLQEAITVAADENLQTLTAKQQALLPRMMKRLVSDFDRLYQNAIPQGVGEYWPYLMGDSFPMRPDMPLAEADLVLRAFYGYECVYDEGGKRYIILGGEANPSSGTLPVCGGFIRAKSIRKR
jgi:methionyl-tRNA formyltransferase